MVSPVRTRRWGSQCHPVVVAGAAASPWVLDAKAVEDPSSLHPGSPHPDAGAEDSKDSRLAIANLDDRVGPGAGTRDNGNLEIENLKI